MKSEMLRAISGEAHMKIKQTNQFQKQSGHREFSLGLSETIYLLYVITSFSFVFKNENITLKTFDY